MLKKLSTLLIFSLFLTACGWHFKNHELLPTALRTLHFASSDEYSEMSRSLRSQLLLNNVKLVDASPEVATLRLNGAVSESRVASVFKQAREAEKILLLTVKATVSVPKRGDFPLEVSVNRTFFDDSRAALAKSAESEAIQHAMYEQASEQLIIKMISLQKSLATEK